MEVEDSRNAPGPGHEREFDMVSVPTVTGGSPGALVDEPGKLVGFGTRVGPECSAPVAAMLNVTSALRKGLREYRQAYGYELAPMDRPVPVAPGSLKWHPDRVAESSGTDRCSDNLEYRSLSGDVAASRSAGRAHSGPDKVRVVEANELVGAVSYTPPCQLPVCSGGNVILPEDSLSDISVLDIEVEQNMGEFEVQNSVNSCEVVSQPINYGQREVSHSVVSMEVCSEDSLYPGTVSVQQPVVGVCPDLSVVNEVSEVSHNPSSRSTLPMTGEARSESPVLRTAVEARTKLVNAINEARSQTRSQLSVFRPVEFESTPVSSYPRGSRLRIEAVPEVAQQGNSTGYSRLDDEVLVRCGASSQPVRVAPRQPYGQSLLDRTAPTASLAALGSVKLLWLKGVEISQ